MCAEASLFVSTLTDLTGGDDVEKFGMLIDSQTEDVIRVLQIKALSSCKSQTPSSTTALILQSVLNSMHAVLMSSH